LKTSPKTIKFNFLQSKFPHLFLDSLLTILYSIYSQVNKMKNPYLIKKVIGILLIIVAAAGLVYVGYWYNSQDEELVSEPDVVQSSASVPTAQPSSWLKYVNQRFNYSFKYPSNLQLEGLSLNDDPSTQEVESGDEGTFIVEPATASGAMARSMVVMGLYLTASQKNMTLKQFVDTQGTLINPCHESAPAKTQEITSISGVKGIKAWYRLTAGCEGAGEKELNDPYVYFDARPNYHTLIEFYEGQLDDVFDSIVSTFTFEKPGYYGD
jgi:hypothetical protein